MYKDLKPYKNRYDQKLYNEIPYYRNSSDFERIGIGQVWEYDSKKHPEYQAYKRKQAHNRKMSARQYKKDREERFEYMLTLVKRKAEEKKSKEREIDNLKRLAAGFDEESFKGEFYHGRKNKKKCSL